MSEDNDRYDDEIPVKFNPSEDLPQVNLQEERVAMAQELRENVAKELGLLTVSRDVISTLERIGLDIETLGTLKVANGFCFMSQQSVLLCISKISEAVQDGTDVGLVANAMSKLANAMTNSVKVMKLGSWQKQPLHIKPSIEIGFTPGRKIKLNDPQTP